MLPPGVPPRTRPLQHWRRALSCACVLFGTTTAQAEPTTSGEALHWQPSWQRAGAFDYAWIGVSVATAAAAYAFEPAPGDWQLDVDESARATLRAASARGRVFARDGADVLVALTVAYPVAIESVANAGWYRRSPDVARELVVIQLKAATLTAALTGVSKALVGRERPYGRECGESLSNDTYECRDRDRHYSFWSGHASASFSAASVTCVQNRFVPLWGRETTLVPCLSTLTLAATTAGLRVVADQHYLSDVVVGALIGTGVGLTIPWLHFRADGDEGASLAATHRLTLVPMPHGVALTGVF